MSPRIITASLGLLAALGAGPLQARGMQARIDRVVTPVATLEQVRVRVDWPAGASAGELQLWAGRVDAPDLGYRYRDLHWRCPLRRDGEDGWRCEGALRSGRSAPLQLAVHFDAVHTRASLAQGKARIELDRDAASPDLTSFDLTRVPVQWAQVLLAKAWPEASFKSGELDARLTIDAATNRPLRISGPLALRGIGLETADASVAGENLGGRFAIDYRLTPVLSLLAVDGELRGGE